MEQIIEMSCALMSRNVTLEDTAAVIRVTKRIRKLLAARHPRFRWLSDDILPFLSTLHLICSNWGSSYIDDWTTIDCFSSLAYAFVETEFEVMRMITDEVLCCNDGLILFRKNCIQFLLKFAFYSDIKSDEDAMYHLCVLIKSAKECEEIDNK